MFHSLAIRGADGVILAGAEKAALLARWSITREIDPKRGPWVLSAACLRLDRYYCGTRPLYFTARKLGGGRWCWPVLDLQLTGRDTLTARLGHPEQ